ncbi:Fe(3+)-hydroxamate ABC transporter permease FhuB [Microvirga sp. VF16]|uniref:Fe(3+)-hydroxamate ABC transporter permease FhuB n=1 Tax=Microvirga sp. VF16 TaxID=2807101 RepID=UPI00193CFC0E|nr:Fe(3+)-hydroxamate ABC transporter permease FhuB [Microvirga sp. VF16]QRM32613.1 Fe(3+)-hydroxamate ABC transporter permease FhuB [Microvirga sp. VF16]
MSVSDRLRCHPAVLVLALLGAAATASLLDLARLLPAASWSTALLSPDPNDMRQLVVFYSLLPRLVTALLAGAALALAGVLMQQVLRNPLASPTTLGIEAGARLALAAGTLWTPVLAAGFPMLVAFAGGAATLAGACLIAWRNAFAPTTLVLAGLVIGLYAGALGAILVLFNEHYLTGLFIWGGGSLSLQDWSAPNTIGLALVFGFTAAFMMIRPLTLLDLDGDMAASLGVASGRIRIAGLALAVALPASVVAEVGVIGFIGLVAPTLARLAGARRLRDRLIWAPPIGGGLLWLADGLARHAVDSSGEFVPTGAVTALFGAPLLLFMLPRLTMLPTPPRREAPAVTRRPCPTWRVLMLLCLGLMATIAIALVAAPGPSGWTISLGEDLAPVLPWRGPRLAAALVAGAMLAVAGVVLQRLTDNGMASPEVLGTSAGAMLGAAALAVLVADAGRPAQLMASGAGALLATLAVLSVARRGGFTPERMVLVGIALGSLCDALVSALIASGDQRAQMLLGWMTGSTYRVTTAEAAGAAILGLVGTALSGLMARPLDLLPLGGPAAQALGLDLRRARRHVLLVAAGLTAGAATVVGPLSFVGLIAPHLAKMLGLRRALPQILGAALLGALLMTAADWLGRTMLLPRQAPAGLVAALVGGPALIIQLARRR